MSYILEALRKMERQRRRETGPEQWLYDVSSEPEEGKGPKRGLPWFIAAGAIFFGVSGIIAGLLFYHSTREPVSADLPSLQRDTQIHEPPPARKETALPEKKRGEEVRAKAPAGGGPNLRAATLSEIQAHLNKEGPGEQRVEGKPIDLTRTYRLTSTGEVDRKKYATIDRMDYFVGDEFMGMIITGMDRDRVYLTGKADQRPYVIVFRYR